MKDCAAKCRQAVECITDNLWSKLLSFVPDGISVKLRKLKYPPDLNQKTMALVGVLKKGFDNTDAIKLDLSNLLQAQTWKLLNIGTHYDNSIPEFTRSEIKNLLELVEHLAHEVNKLKISTRNH